MTTIMVKKAATFKILFEEQNGPDNLGEAEIDEMIIDETGLSLEDFGVELAEQIDGKVTLSTIVIYNKENLNKVIAAVDGSQLDLMGVEMLKPMTKPKNKFKI
jgi:predicted aspartyl protease